MCPNPFFFFFLCTQLAEFRHKVGSVLPPIPKKDNPGRGDFKTIRDLFNYLIEEDEKEKAKKKIS